MSRLRSFPISLRRLVLAGVAAVAMLGIVGGVAPTAQAYIKTIGKKRTYIKTIGKSTICHRTTVTVNREKDMPVSQLSPSERTEVARCVINAARHDNSVYPTLGVNAQLGASALAHAQRSVSLRWWDLNDGLVSHVDPDQGTLNPNDTFEQQQPVVNAAIGERIANAGYCPSGSRRTGEITFSSAGLDGEYPATIAGAVKFWLYHDEGHRAMLLNRSMLSVGIGVLPGFAFPGDTGDAPTATFVVDFGACRN
jgi:hypothetical protein